MTSLGLFCVGLSVFAILRFCRAHEIVPAFQIKKNASEAEAITSSEHRFGPF